MPRNAQIRPHTFRETFRDAQKPPKKAAEMFGDDHRRKQTLKEAQRRSEIFKCTLRERPRSILRRAEALRKTPRETSRNAQERPDGREERHAEPQRRSQRYIETLRDAQHAH